MLGKITTKKKISLKRIQIRKKKKKRILSKCGASELQLIHPGESSVLFGNPPYKERKDMSRCAPCRHVNDSPSFRAHLYRGQKTQHIPTKLLRSIPVAPAFQCLVCLPCSTSSLFDSSPENEAHCAKLLRPSGVQASVTTQEGEMGKK